MLTFGRLVRSGIAIVGGAGLAAAQWSTVEIQEVQLGGPGKAAFGTAGASDGSSALISVPQAQLWYRDPASTSNQPTSLSDALEFYVNP